MIATTVKTEMVLLHICSTVLLLANYTCSYEAMYVCKPRIVTLLKQLCYGDISKCYDGIFGPT